jgi:N-acetylmuramoyl-L-alanine amidase
MKNAIVYHHTGNPSKRSQLAETIAYHKKKFGQAGAYHFLIDSDATVHQLHDEEFTGYHAGHWLTNLRSIGICLAGDFTKSSPTDAQIDALTKLTLDIQSRRGISELILHREVNPPHTQCPGTDLRALVEAHKKTLLKVRLSIAEKALPRVSGPRKAMLTRFIERLRSIL